jgi:VWFA-related protein
MSSQQLRWAIFGIFGFCVLGFAQDRPPKTAEQIPKSSISAAAPLVTLDVSVLTKDGMFIPGLKQENFRLLEDGVPQALFSFSQTQGPITTVLLVEFANNGIFYGFAYDTLVSSATFAQTLKREDRIALITYDIKPHILQNFTQDKNAMKASISMLQPGKTVSTETNLYDALYDTLDRLASIEGKKYVILVSSGVDAFSGKTFDQLLNKVQTSRDIAIYSMSTGEALRNYMEGHGVSSYLCPITDFSCAATYAQAENQMTTLAKTTGGSFVKPVFETSFRDAFADLGNSIRNQYTLAYRPTNRAQDGSYRKIKVALVDENGQPLQMRDRTGKEIKYTIATREGYTAIQ